MTKGLFKDFLREIRKSLNRFISILCIVAIGTAFFVGLKSAAPDMSYTMDNFYDDYRVADLEVFSTLGLTDDDLTAIRELDMVEEVQSGYFTDALANSNGIEFVFRIHSLPQSYLSGGHSINELKLTEGRMPQNDHEMVVEYNYTSPSGLAVGDKVTFSSGTAEKLTDGTLSHDTFTVVGLAVTPYYLTYDKGTSQIGGKALNYFAYVPESAFTIEGYYTQALVKVKGAEALNAFDSDYQKLVEEASVQLANIGVDRSQERTGSLKDGAYAELDKAQKKYDKEEKKFNTEIKKAEDKLSQALKDITEGEKQLAVESGKFELELKHAEERMTEAQHELDLAKIQIEQGRKDVTEGEIAYENARREYEAAMAQNQKYVDMLADLEGMMARLDTQMVRIGDALAEAESNPHATEEQKQFYHDLYAQYEELYATTSQQYQDIQDLNNGVLILIGTIEDTLDATEAQLAQARQDLATAQVQYDQGVAELNAAKANLAEKKAQAEGGFAEAQGQIDQGRKDYEEGKKELERQRTKGQKQLDEAKMQLVDAKYEIDRMENAEWYVLDRNTNYGFVSYKSTVDRMSALAQIMPVFFILVAVLVCMTTMTRMVAEQRTIIGTYKALGYDNGAISSKYILYVTAASLVGAVIGAALGSLFFPRAVYDAWQAMYSQPEFTQTLHPMILVSSLVVSVAAMIVTAWYTCHLELVSVPAQLMRPKAPKIGKTILLERIPAIWKHLNFSQKVTARNIFRYKKRLAMTIIGIMGCTALLLAGLGINDTISTVVDNQFGKVFQYDISLEMKHGLKQERRAEIGQLVGGNEHIAEFTHVGTTSFTLKNETHSVTSSAYVTDNPNSFGNYIQLRNRASGQELHLPDDGVVLTEKLAEQLDVGVGDSVEITNADGITKKLEVVGITENYVFHYVYMSQDCYEKFFWYSVEQNNILMKLADGLTDQQTADLCSMLENTEGVTSVVTFTEVAADFADQISALKSIIALIIVCAAALAFVVLYNLTNINISERTKEIATIKVLGFNSREVAMYVYRENFLLTLMGGVLGLGLGVGLHWVIMKSIEQSNIMFGYHISPLSFVLALVLTCLFSVLVMLYMYRKLTNIPMVESLKAIE